ncbi:MAG: anti-sigma factor antagonist [Clostridia bacterium]
MEIKVINNNQVLAFLMFGELDESTSEYARNVLDCAIRKEKNFKRVVYDFKNLNFMDSTGIGVLIGRYKLLAVNKIPQYVSNVSGHIDKILNTSGLYNIFKKL